MRTDEIRGHAYTIEDTAFRSWAAFELIAVVSDDKQTPFDRAGSMFKLVELVTNLKKADVIEIAGGESASVDDVLGVLAEIIAKIAPKN